MPFWRSAIISCQIWQDSLTHAKMTSNMSFSMESTYTLICIFVVCVGDV